MSQMSRQWKAKRTARIVCGIVVLAVVTLFPLSVFTTNAVIGSYGQQKQTPGGLDRRHLQRLTVPLSHDALTDTPNEQTYIVGEHHTVYPDIRKDYVWVDPENRKPYKDVLTSNANTNSALARMPAGSPYDAYVVGRGSNGRYHDPREEPVAVMNLTIVGFFVNYNAAKGKWVRAGPLPYVLDMPVWRQWPRPCPNNANGGAADPRTFWSDAGEPLMVAGTASRVAGVCKTVGMVDLRAVWPDLRNHLEEIGYGAIPITFNKFTEIGKAGKPAQYEKNWAAFFPGVKPAISLGGRLKQWTTERKGLAKPSYPLFASSVFPHTIVEIDTTLDTSERSTDSYVLGQELDLGAVSEAASACIKSSMPKNWAKERFHQATPFHRVTMCPRGTCEPDESNTVLVGLIHYKMDWVRYRRMFVTMSPVAPFNVLSVSPALHFGSREIDNNVVFSVSLAFFPTKHSSEMTENSTFIAPHRETPSGWLSHGWLDDTIVVGNGLRDLEYSTVHLDVATALSGHTICGGFP